MIESILGWFLQQILQFMFKKATEELKAAAEAAAEDLRRNKADSENVKRYEEAKTRAEEIEAATDLLNGTSRA